MMAAILGGAAVQQHMQQQQGQAQPVIAPLSDLISSNDVMPLLDNEAVVDALLPHLPEGQRTAEELRRTISTPQFRSTLRTLTSALMSDNYNTVMANFGLEPTAGSEALAQGNPVLALQAIQAQADSNPAAQTGPKKYLKNPTTRLFLTGISILLHGIFCSQKRHRTCHALQRSVVLLTLSTSIR